MNTALPRLFLAIASCAIGFTAWGVSAPARASSTGTCNLEGNITLSLLGVPLTAPVECVNPTHREVDGTDEEQLLGSQEVGVPLMDDVATLKAPYGGSKVVTGPTSATFMGRTSVAKADLLQGTIHTDDSAGGLLCTETSSEVHCVVAADVVGLSFLGQPLSAPPQPIPPNYDIALSGASLNFNLPGLAEVSFSGKATLNHVDVKDNGTGELRVTQGPLALTLTGHAYMLGIGLIDASITLVDKSDYITRPSLPMTINSVSYESIMNSWNSFPTD